ncbi:translation initiation factor eIF 4e-like domain-containing protein [Mycena rosella]|uniref:Translation initiation factor eIF 4e-like domain-containing protein n=1 Tax=Mycena rosella TaxID=1033263 RepID=A0AAD7CTV0_MYCRO|nr:translation initiation factor eIF 4e-like domain-containing protein [Mycena rosella]
MSYFSNHSSQSRFLAISASSSSPAVLTTAPAEAPAQSQPQRARSTSKHFSTSVEAHAHAHGEGREAEESVVSPTVHPLRNTWVFWFRQQRAPGNKILSYEEGIKRVAAFSSVESFWALHTHLAPPSLLTPTTDYLLFHTGITRPVWEDPLNITGGKWIIRLRKGVADRVWEALLCAVVGDMFAGCRDAPPRESWEDGSDAGDADGEGDTAEDDAFPEICGCTISVRQSEDIISLWNRVDQDVQVRERIRDTLRVVLGIPASTIMEYKSNNDSMQDKSSFRNSAIDRTPLA